MTTVSLDYGAGAASVTMTLASLASDTNLVAGRESAEVDNTSTKALDYIAQVTVMTGTTPTASRQIEIWVAASLGGTTYSGGATGADANFTPTEKSLMGLARIIPTSGTSNVAYTAIFSVAEALGMKYAPPWFSFFVVHNTGVALNATGGNHSVQVTPVKVVGA